MEWTAVDEFEVRNASIVRKLDYGQSHSSWLDEYEKNLASNVWSHSSGWLARMPRDVKFPHVALPRLWIRGAGIVLGHRI